MSLIDPVVALPGAREKGGERRRAFGFGATIAAVLGAVGLWNVHHGVAATKGWIFLGIAAFVLAYSVVHPAGALALRRLWVRLGGLLGRVNGAILLSVAYACVLTPLSLVVRAFGRRSYRHAPGEPYFSARSEPRDAKHFEHPY